MRQFALTSSVARSPQPQLKSAQTGYYREVSEAHLAAVCQTLAALTSVSEQQQGWVLVLAPQLHLNKQVLEQCQIDCQRLLLINQKHLITPPHVPIQQSPLHPHHMLPIYLHKFINSKTYLTNYLINLPKRILILD